MKFTSCECTEPGWCARHRCQKSDGLFHLCQRSRDAFAAWENGRGPCFADPDHPPVDGEHANEPGLIRRAVNFGSALVRHAADGLRHVSDEEYAARLKVCEVCSSCDLERFVCREPACGCQLRTKARWQSENCPLGKWPSANDV